MNFTNTKNNMDPFNLMIEICRKSQSIPLKYVDDMISMHKKCSIEKQNSKTLCKLIIKATDGIPGNKNAFQYVANVYNELLQLTKNDSTSPEVENCVASTSNGSANMYLDVDNGTESNTVDENTKIFNEVENCVASTSNGSANMYLDVDNGTESNTVDENTKIFNEFIEKCYQNPEYPKSDIQTIDKLYRSLPPELINTKYFSKLLKESNQVIWPDSNVDLYDQVLDVYKQLLKFESSMKVQNSETDVKNNEANIKKNKKLSQLKKTLKAVRKKILFLEEEEMDIDNDDDYDVNSPYILKDRYEKRIVQIYKKICKISKEPDFLEEPNLCFNETNNELINKTVQRFYNVKKSFPNYYDIYTLLKILRDTKKLNWNESQLKNISQNAFLKLGKVLKLRRLKEYYFHMSHFDTEADPAENNLELKKKLDESNEKLHADLNALTEKYTNIQDYAEETEGSSLNNTECENSSDNESSYENQPLNNKFKSIKTIPVKRKKVLSKKLANNEPKKKSQKTIYMESIHLTPCSVALEPLNNLVFNETNVNVKKVLDKVVTKEIINDNVQSKKTINDLENITNDISENSYHISSFNAENLDSYDLAVEVYSDGDGTLVIDEEIHIDNNINKTITTKSLKNNISKIKCDKKSVHSSNISIDTQNFNPIISEPEVIISVSENLGKDGIEIIELNDSDEEITSLKTPKAPLHKKKTLEPIIKSMNFPKAYNFDQAQRPIQRPPIQRFPSISIQRPLNSERPHGLQNRHSYNQNLNNSNHNLVNYWTINNMQPQRTNRNHFIRPPFKNRLSSVNHRMQQSTFIRSTTRHVPQRFSNSVQQQSNLLNNQQVQQHSTTMTTTTTVRGQIVQESAESSGRRQSNTPTNRNRRPVPFRSNTNDHSELIELD